MGFDTYCFLCGNTNYNFDINKDELEDLHQSFTEFENLKTKNKKYKYYEQVYNNIYKLSKKEDFNIHLKNLKDKTKWLNKCTFLTIDNRIIHNCKDGDSQLYSNNGDSYTIGDIDGIDSGLYVHDNCWKFIKTKYGIELKYGDLPIINERNYNLLRNSPFDFIKYDRIKKYQLQYFDFYNILNTKDEELCISPLIKNPIISKVFPKLKIRKDRLGPSQSVSFYKNGTYKVGNNENIWYVKSGKWIELKNTIKTKIKEKDINKKNVKYIGQTNTKPEFIILKKNQYYLLTIEKLYD